MRKKLNDRSDSMIFIGYYPIGSYKLYDPKGKMIVIIRDVILDESKWWNWDEGNPKASMKMWLLEGHITETELSKIVQAKRPQRNRQQPQRLNDFKMLLDILVTQEGDLVHLALFIKAKPMIFEEAIQDEKWSNAMK